MSTLPIPKGKYNPWCYRRPLVRQGSQKDIVSIFPGPGTAMAFAAGITAFAFGSQTSEKIAFWMIIIVILMIITTVSIEYLHQSKIKRDELEIFDPQKVKIVAAIILGLSILSIVMILILEWFLPTLFT